MPPLNADISLPQRKIQYLAEILFNVGTEAIQKRDFERATTWLKRALALYSRANTQDEEEAPETVLELKYNVMRNLVKALYSSDESKACLEEANLVLQQMNEEYSSTIWSLLLKFEIVVKEGASADALSDGLLSQIWGKHYFHVTNWMYSAHANDICWEY